MAAWLVIAAIALAVCAGIVVFIAERTFKRENELDIKERKAQRKRK